ncbi:MAG TPA: ABC transporter ATP-binding protein [Steroidobacteraceae bacterium]|nr:ABC transporter ATP-binding protein [Steroidobacteraceae bacterium]
MLAIRQLRKSFHEGARVQAVLEGAEASIARGEIVAITGRSGSGKSTLLNLVSGIDTPDAGTIALDGTELTALGEPARTRWRRAHVGFVYQFFNLIPTLDALENVRLVLELNGVRGAPARTRSAAALAQVGLCARAHAAVEQLSGGEQQRVAIARALVHRPRLLLADEPTGNLDEVSAREVVPLLLGHARTGGATLLMVTHDHALAAQADRVLELRGGTLHPAGSAA